MAKNKKENLAVPFALAVSSFYLAGKVADGLYEKSGCKEGENMKNLAKGLALSGASYMAVKSVSNKNSTAPVSVLLGTMSSYLFSYSKYKEVCSKDSNQGKSGSIAAYFKKEKEKERSVRYIEPDLA